MNVLDGRLDVKQKKEYGLPILKYDKTLFATVRKTDINGFYFVRPTQSILNKI